MTAVETTNLTKQYGERTALDEFDLEIEHGEIFGFLGPNGAGKSTTIDIFLDFIRPTDGRAIVADHNPQDSPLEVRQNIGVLPDDYSLYDSLTGSEHIELAKDLNGSDEDTNALLSRVGLADAGDQPTGNYSKGMAQRLAFGMALVGDPDVLILDEPSTGIDPNGVQDIRELIREEAASGTTIFFSTHILEQVEAICDRVAIINEGELVAVDTISGLRETFDTQSILTLSVDGTPTDLDLHDLNGVSQVEHSGDTIRVYLRDPQLKSTAITQVEASGASISDIEIKEASLTELFNRLTTGGDGA
ncbi:ABC transporter ATP-binding protein [Natrinema longum]|uniref:ABC transporter ATP-binding protein n=1 Tax=Natrinema longum TaxID=370324 RepID=UPI001CCBA34A|nr:ABC transporter ATP-binding protein [Natrinema longum]MBZ6497054.1 ABC transporter ATP-binding protein [Natrinema longum]